MPSKGMLLELLLPYYQLAYQGGSAALAAMVHFLLSFVL